MHSTHWLSPAKLPAETGLERVIPCYIQEGGTHLVAGAMVGQPQPPPMAILKGGSDCETPRDPEMEWRDGSHCVWGVTGSL